MSPRFCYANMLPHQRGLLKNNLTVQLTEVPCGQGGFHLTNYINRINELNPALPVIIEHLSLEEEYMQAIDYIRTLPVA